MKMLQKVLGGGYFFYSHCIMSAKDRLSITFGQSCKYDPRSSRTVSLRQLSFLLKYPERQLPPSLRLHYDIMFCLRAKRDSNEITLASFSKLKPKPQNIANPKAAVRAIWNDLPGQL